MSLVPYHPSDNNDRQIVLRHEDLIVLRDPDTQRLNIRRRPRPPSPLTECPYCHHPNRKSPSPPSSGNASISPDDSPEARGDRRGDRRGSFVSPEYFALLQQARNVEGRSGQARMERNPEERYLDGETPILIGRQSPIRRLTQPVVDRVRRALSPSKEEDDHKEEEKPTYSYPTYSDGSEGDRSLESSRNNTRPGSRAASVDDESSPTRPVVNRRESSDKAGIRRSAFSDSYFENFFITEKQLGSGGKGVVLLVRHQLDGVDLGRFACKRVPVGDDHAWLEKVLIEVQLLQKLSHPNLVSYRHVWLENVKISAFGPKVPCAYILQEYCDAGDLLRYVVGDKEEDLKTSEKLKAAMRRKSRGAPESERPNLRAGTGESTGTLPPGGRKLPFEEIYSFFHDITAGLAHLHAKNYIHRDLKPSNVLMQRMADGEAGSGTHLRCLISDFGEVQASSAARAATGATGTISYCAPEVLLPPSKTAAGGEDLPFGNFTAKSDIFSLGMILYFMCFGRLPYVSAGKDIIEEFEDVDGLREEISGWHGYERKKERDDLPEQVYALLRALLDRDPAKRPSAQEILALIERPDTPERKNPVVNSIETGDKPTKRYRALKDDTPSSSDTEGRNRPQAARKQSVTDEYDAKSGRHGGKSPLMSHALRTRPNVTIHQEPSSPLSHPHVDLKEIGSSPGQPGGLSRALSPVPAALLMPPPIPHHPLSYLVMHPYHAVSLLPPRQVFLLSLSTRLALLLIRLYVLSTICLPWGMNPWVLGAFLGAIFMEWSYNARGRVRMALFATTAQFALLYGLTRVGWLCEGGFGEGARHEFWG